MAAAYSVRGRPEANVSTPITWDEVDDVEPEDCTMQTVPERFARLGDLHGGIDDAVFAIDPLLEWAGATSVPAPSTRVNRQRRTEPRLHRPVAGPAALLGSGRGIADATASGPERAHRGPPVGRSERALCDTRRRY
jgi:hypothetical protein